MAVINKKNVLNLGKAQRQKIWDEIRDKPELDKVFTAKDLLNSIPGGGAIGAFIGSFLRFSVSVHGLVEFLIGDDPGASV